MARERTPERPTEQRAHWSGRIFSALFGTLAWLFFGMLISIALEWAGMLFWWPDHKAIHGVLHARAQLDAELSYLAADFRSALLGLKPATVAANGANELYRFLFVWHGTDAAQWLLSRAAGSLVSDYLLSAIYQIQLYGVRLAIAVLSLPAFAILGLVASIEGLTDRQLRKAGADIEHSLIYHFAKSSLLPTLVATWVFYLSLPFSLHPNWIFVPGVLLFGYALRVSVANFKTQL